MPSPILCATYKSIVGELIIGIFEDQLCMIDWTYRRMRPAIDKRLSDFFQTNIIEADHSLQQEVMRQLHEYFNRERTEFSLPLLFAGTDFQQSVWKQLQLIPYGQTQSYLELARSMQQESAIRAVAAANGANALSIVVPCHRVIGSKGELTGYAGGLTAKRRLLALEGSFTQGELF